VKRDNVVANLDNAANRNRGLPPFANTIIAWEHKVRFSVPDAGGRGTALVDLVVVASVQTQHTRKAQAPV
jgi:hypothetical protein